MRIALVAHDNKKADLVEWARANRTTLSHHALLATSSTGELLEADGRYAHLYEQFTMHREEE